MSLAGIYLFLALFSAFSTFAAIVQARKISYLAPVYFLCAWLCGELALLHIIWQVALTAVLAFFGGLSDPLVQTGLWVFAVSWLGMVYLHCQALDTAGRLRPALGKGLGENYRQDIPPERRSI